MCLQEAPPASDSAAAAGGPPGILSGAEAEAAEERYGTTAVEGAGAGGAAHAEQARWRDADVAGPSSISAMLREVEVGLKDWRRASKPDSRVSRDEKAQPPGHLTSNDSRCRHHLACVRPVNMHLE